MAVTNMAVTLTGTIVIVTKIFIKLFLEKVMMARFKIFLVYQVLYWVIMDILVRPF